MEDLSAAVARWLADFEQALRAPGDAPLEALQALFRPDAHWRDLLALTWRVGTVSGASSGALSARSKSASQRAAAADHSSCFTSAFTVAGW